MNLTIIGGGLQGLELCYLAKKAGIKTTLLDKKESPIAKNIADDFKKIDITKSPQKLRKISNNHQHIIPATENHKTLKFLKKGFNNQKTLFDFENFFLTSNKKKMYKKLSKNTKIPPNSTKSKEFPLIVKPIHGSGSKGIKKISNEKKLEKIKSEKDLNKFLVQKYLKGKQYSTEAIVKNNELYTYQTTLLEFKKNYGCCRIVCSPKIPKKIIKKQKRVIKNINKSFNNISHLFDVQTIFYGSQIYVIEINARSPSQTPISVYWSTGINLLKQLIKPSNYSYIKEKPVILEHFKSTKNGTKIINESKLLQGSDYKIKDKIKGCKEAILGKTKENKVIGTVIFKENNLIDIHNKRKKFYNIISNTD